MVHFVRHTLSQFEFSVADARFVLASRFRIELELKPSTYSLAPSRESLFATVGLGTVFSMQLMWLYLCSTSERVTVVVLLHCACAGNLAEKRSIGGGSIFLRFQDQTWFQNYNEMKITLGQESTTCFSDDLQHTKTKLDNLLGCLKILLKMSHRHIFPSITNVINHPETECDKPNNYFTFPKNIFV